MITSASNPRLKLVRKLASGRQRAKLGLFVCEGEDLVAAGLAAGITPVEALVGAERPVELEGLEGAEEVEQGLLAELSSLAHPPRIVAIFRRADLPKELDAPTGLALWHVGDPGNVGTLVRTADALGPAFVALSPGCADPTSPKALRASMGAIFRVPTGSFDDAPHPWVGLVPRGGTALAEAEF
jgi:RNA methyltransferase, TrmH family